MQFIRSLFFTLFFYFWTFLCVTFYFPLAFFARDYRQMTIVPYHWGWGIINAMRLICGTSYEIRGLEHMHQDKPCVFVSKHQSTWETLAFFVILKQPIFVLKQELVNIFGFGYHLKKMGMIAVNRKGQASAIIHMVTEARDRLAKGFPLVIFPEGTRVNIGEHEKFHPGVAALYSQESFKEVAFVPVALNSGYFWPRKGIMKRRGKIIVEFLPPVSKELDRKAMMPKLEELINSRSDQLVEEAKRQYPEPL